MTSEMMATVERISSAIARTVRNGRAVYVKRYTEGDWGATAEVVRQRAQREVELVARIQQSTLFGGRLGVVQVVSADPEQATLTTAEVPGDTLEAVVRRRTQNLKRDGLQAMYLAGRWLKQFQMLTVDDAEREPISELDPSDLVEYCSIRLERMGDNGHQPLPSRLCTRILTRVRGFVDETADDAEKRLVWSHADYAPGNIIWDGHTLTPIDFAMAHADRPLLDVTYFIHRLEMQRVYRPWKRWPVEVWTRAFLRGYGRPDAEQSPMYQALMIRHLICRLHTYVRRPPRDWKQRLHDKWVRRVLRNRLEREARKNGD